MFRSPSDYTPPPAPPYYLWEEKMVTGAATSSGFFFLCFFSCFAWCGLNGRVRGGGRSKWFGVQDLRIERPPMGGPEDRGYFPTQAPVPSAGGFLTNLPRATRRVVVDPSRQGLLVDA